MLVAPSNIALPFEYTAFDMEPGLFMAMTVWDVSGVPAIVAFTTMPHIADGTYLGFFTATEGRAYLVQKAAYTDGSYLVLDTNRSPGSESFITQTTQAGIVDNVPLSSALPGTVITTISLSGAITDTLLLSGTVTEVLNVQC